MALAGAGMAYYDYLKEPERIEEERRKYFEMQVKKEIDRTLFYQNLENLIHSQGLTIKDPQFMKFIQELRNNLGQELKVKKVTLETFMKLHHACCLGGIASNSALTTKHRALRRAIKDKDYLAYIAMIQEQQKIENQSWENSFKVILELVGVNFDLYAQLYVQFIKLNQSIQATIHQETRRYRKSITITKDLSGFTLEDCYKIMHFMIENFVVA